MALSPTASRLFATLVRRGGLARFLSLLNVSLSVDRDGFRYTLPLRGGVGFGFEDPPPPWEARLYRLLLETGDSEGVFLDVGANYGQSFLRFLQHRRKGQGYFGVDAIPECCAYVRLLASRNRIGDAQVVAVALGEQPGLAELLVPETEGSDSSLSSLETSLRPEESYRARLLVPMTSGDLLLANLAPPRAVCFVKIDVEGFELGVLRGLRETLRRHRPPVLCEVMPSNHPDPAQRERRRGQIAETTAFLESLDYRLYHARHDGGLEALERLPEADWDAACGNDYDYLFLPEEMAAELSASWTVAE